MTRAELLRFDDAPSLAAAAAGRWMEEVGATEAADAAFCVALSGGRIAGTLFDEVARRAAEQGSRLERVHFFWADERCVPPDHPESNFRLASARLLDPLGIAPMRIHRIPGEKPSRQAALEAAREVLRVAGDVTATCPSMDLILLGMGEDGHVASLFPGDTAPEDPQVIYREVIGPKPPPQRVTLSYHMLAAAREVWVLASGPGKASALASALKLDTGVPLGRLFSLRRQTLVFTDIRT